MKNSVGQGFGRRRFLKQAMTVIPGMIAITGAAQATPISVDDSSSADTKNGLGQGYRETAHIKKYYEKAGF